MRPFPVEARHAEYSLILSADDDPARPTDRLIDLALRAADRARTMPMRSLVERMRRPPYYPDIWPGEHYRLLAGLVAVGQPKVVIEIGTFTGLSALALLSVLPAQARLHSFDLIPWNRIPETCLRPEDFADGRLIQEIGDVSEAGTMAHHASVFRSADLIFIDGPKDGRFEPLLMRQLREIGLPRQPLLVFDDIRVWNMLAFWRNLRLPKLDITSFGHWSGTGLVDWIDPLPG